jgi:SpoIID/LytB domain protein
MVEKISVTIISGNTKNIATAAVAAILCALFMLILQRGSFAVPTSQFTKEPEVRIGILQKAIHARLTFNGSYRVFKANEPLELRSSSNETLQIELYIVHIEQLPNRFHVSIGHFRSFEQAEYILDRLGSLKFNVKIAQPKQWSIILGPFDSLNDAHSALDFVQKKGFLDSRVEPENSDIPVITVYAPDGSLVHLGNDPVVFYPSNGRFKLNDHEYRGDAEVTLDAYGTISIINRVKAEDYLYSVIPREMPPSASPEALKAQAVIARTYLLNNMNRHIADGFNLCSTTDCQVYGGVDDETDSSIQAVRATRGQALTYGGNLVNALFHSTCGGKTANYSDIWDGESPPYLTSVDEKSGFDGKILSGDKEIADFLSKGAGYCKSSKYFRWDKTYTGEQMLNVIKQTLPEFTNNPELKINSLNGISILSRSASGRVQRIMIETDAGTFYFEKDAIRWVLGNLKSTLFILDTSSTGDARTYKFTGSGWGHGLGLCQIGAMNLAKDYSYSYRQILEHYYPQTSITSLWK